jgi:hypothetical protein
VRSTMFLSGPWTHIKKMMEKGRIVATIIYFASMFLTLFCAIHVSQTNAHHLYSDACCHVDFPQFVFYEYNREAQC